MIIEKLVFVINAKNEFVSGSVPVGKLTANSINKDFIYVISPTVPATSITVTFKSNLQGAEGERAYLKLTDEKVSDLVESHLSYYDLIKDWRVWKTHIPSKALKYISHNIAGDTNISFNFKELLVAKNLTDLEYKGDMVDFSDYKGDGYYIIKTLLLEHDGLDFRYNDIMTIKNGLVNKIPSIKVLENTPRLKYTIDASVYDDDFEVVEFDLVDDLMILVGEGVDKSNYNSQQIEGLRDEVSDNRDRINSIELSSDLENYYNKQEVDYKLDNLEIDGGTFI